MTNRLANLIVRDAIRAKNDLTLAQLFRFSIKRAKKEAWLRRLKRKGLLSSLSKAQARSEAERLIAEHRSKA